MARRHPDGGPTQPALPDFRDELARRGVVGQPHGAVLVGRVAGGHAPVVEKLAVAFSGEGGAAAEVLPELVEGAVIVLTESSNRLRKVVRVRHLEEGVAGVGRQTAEEVRPQHWRDHRTVSATRLAGDAAVARLGQRSVATVDTGHDLVAE